MPEPDGYQHEPVPFPHPNSPRQAGTAAEMPASNGRLLQQPVPGVGPELAAGPGPARFMQRAVQVGSEDTALVRHRLQQLQLGAQAGLFELVGFTAECIGEYQARYRQQTGQEISFQDAMCQISTLLAQVSE